MTISDERVKQVVEYADKHGEDAASMALNVTYETIARYRRLFKNRHIDPLKILILDIENAPVEAYVWNSKMWQVNINPDQVINDWHMICWAAKWLFDSTVLTGVITSDEAIERDDERITKELWKLLDQADIVIAHNAIKFDIPMVNSKFLAYGLMPPSHYRVIDTLQVAKKGFKFTFNKLDYLGRILGVGSKIDTTFQLWLDCMKGEAEALAEMLRYNIQDVLLLEEVYLKLRPWIKSHPNLNLLQDTDKCCPNCGSDSVVKRGTYKTQVNSYDSYRCEDCGAISRMAKVKLMSIAN